MNREGTEGYRLTRVGAGRVIYWGRVFAETDLCGVWAWARVRPAWYWEGCRLWLFARIVWRRVDSRCRGRLDWMTAWEVSGIGEGLSLVRIAGRVLGGRTHDELPWTARQNQGREA